MMVRTVNEQEYAQRRNAILDVTQQFVETRGYEQMTIQEILDRLQISKGAFYHYFDSKPALLLALVERWGDKIDQFVLPIVQDPELPALEKFKRFIASINSFKLERRQFALELARIWYADENALVRQKLYIVRVKRVTPWLAQIIKEGVEEGIFSTLYPEQAARMIISLIEDLGYALAELMLASDRDPGKVIKEEGLQIASATADAMERVLGAKPGSLQQTWISEFKRW